MILLMFFFSSNFYNYFVDFDIIKSTVHVKKKINKIDLFRLDYFIFINTAGDSVFDDIYF